MASAFLDDNYYQHPKLTEEMIEFAESLLNKKLPSTLIKLLKVQNGGYTKGFAFPMKQKTTCAEDHVPLSELFGIITAGNDPTVRWIDTECGEDIHVADSFDDFIDGLVSEAEFAGND